MSQILTQTNFSLQTEWHLGNLLGRSPLKRIKCCLSGEMAESRQEMASAFTIGVSP